VRRIPMKRTDAVDHKKCGAVIRKARREAGLTLRAVSNNSGLSVQYLSALELGRRQWSRKLFEAVINAIDSAISDD